MKKINLFTLLFIFINIICYAQSPGGIGVNPTLWLRADAGTSCVTDECTVDTWFNQSGTQNFTRNGSPKLVLATKENFNPGIRFKNQSYFRRNGWVPYNVNGTHEIYMVVTATGNIAWSTLQGVPAGKLMDVQGGYLNNVSGPGGPKIWGGNAPALQPKINNIRQISANNITTFQNAKQIDTNAHGGIGGIGNSAIGGNNFNGHQVYGHIQEFLAYNVTHTAAQRIAINSYLAIKYGVTLDKTPGNYLASDGVTVPWDDLTYWNDVAGIGRDDNTGLNQRISKSGNLGSIVNIATDNDFTSSNIDASRTSLNNLQFLVWGNDAEPATITSTEYDATQFDGRMAREWKVKNTGNVGAVNLKFNGYLPSRTVTYYLLTDTDGDFTNATVVGPLDANGAITNVTLNDNTFFTIAAVQERSPGGVKTSLELWLRTDDLTVGTITAPGWLDRSVGSNHFEYVYSDPLAVAGSATSGLNYNPIVKFDGGDYLLNNDGNFVNNNTAGDVFAVVKDNNYAGNNGNPFQLGGSNSDYYTYSNQALYSSFGTTDRFGFNPNTGAILDSKVGIASVLETGLKTTDFNIFNVHSELNNWRVSFNNLTFAQTTSNTIDFTTAVEQVGARSLRVWRGEMPEIVNYARVLSDNEKNRVNTYLAILYGKTLGNSTTPISYIDSGGNTIWDNSSYHNNVAGIGNDDLSDLDQRISKSINSGSIVTMATTNDFLVANNDASRTSLTDKQFLIWGNDGAPTTLSSTEFDVAQFNARMAREWKVQNTGGVGAVNLKFDGSGTTSTVTYYLLTDPDGDFTNATVVGPLDENGEITNVTLNNNSFFTIAMISKVPTPGGVVASLELWLRADDLPVGNITAPGWIDRSTDSNDFEAVYNDPLAVAGSATTGLNFNPIVEFDGNDYLRNNDGNFVDNNTAGDVFAVIKDNNIPGSNGGAFDFGGGSASYYTHNNRAIYEDYGTTDRFGFNPTTGTIIDSKPGITSVLESGISPGVFNLYNVHSDTNNWAVAFNSLTFAQTTTNTINFTVGKELIGARPGAPWVGDMPEIINYYRVLSANEKNRVNSYLAIRYGTTLGYTGKTTIPISYLDSRSNTTWDGTANSAYHKDVAGIGNDKRSDLDQRISKSINTGSIVTIATTNNFVVANNDASRTSLTDMQFLIWGNDGGAATLSSREFDPVKFNARMEREWKVQNTGGVGAVNLKFDGIGTTSTATYYLLTDPDGDFTNATVVGPLDENGEITNVILNNNSFFTIAMISKAPGGVLVSDAFVNGVDYTLYNVKNEALDNNVIQKGYLSDLVNVDDIFLREVPDAFGVIFKTNLKIDVAGSYSFISASIDNTFKIYIDGVLNSSYFDISAPNVTITGPPIILSAGMHSLEVHFTDAGRQERLIIQYSGPDTGGTIVNIPATKLFTTPILSTWHKANAGITATGEGAIVTNWLDKSTNKVDLTPVAGHDPKYYGTNAAHLLNFNPSVYFTGDKLLSGDQAFGLPYDKQARTIFGVSGNSIVGSKIIFAYGNDANNQSTMLKSVNYDLNFDFYNYNVPGTNSDAYLKRATLARLQTLTPNTNGISAVKGSISGLSDINSTFNFTTRLNDGSDFSIGNCPDCPGGTGFIGDISEIIVYPWELSINEIDRVESYLALKYGITLGNTTTPTSYIDSGSNIFWNADTTYQNDVAGIGKDEKSDLDQRISKSINAGSIVTIATDNDFTSSNIDASRTSLTDKQFLVWGNDGAAFISASTTQNVNPSGAIWPTFPRKWKITEMGDVPCVYVRFDMTGTTALAAGESYALLIASDADFTTNTLLVSLRRNSSSNLFDTNVNFAPNTDSYFRIVKVTPPTVTVKDTPIIIDTNSNNPNPISSSFIEMKSNTLGFVLTRVAGTGAISTPVEGMLIFDNSTNSLKLYNGASWVPVSTIANDTQSNCP